jgi:hypothetical protein
MTQDDAASELAELDEQVRAALASEPPAEQLVRVQQFWLRQLQLDRRRRRFRHALAVAALLLLALAVSWRLCLPRSSDTPAREMVIENSGASRDQIVADDAGPVAPDKGEEPLASPGRAATVYEQVAFAARLQQRNQAKRSAAAASIAGAIAQLEHDPNADARQLLQSADLPSVSVEPLLLRQLPRSSASRRRAVLQLLAACGTPRSALALLELSRRPQLRAQTLERLEQVVGREGLARLAPQSSDAAVRAAIYRRLWNDPDALDTCLSLVQKASLRDDVLGALDNLTPDLLDALLARLDAEDADVRLAAALVLGHANSPLVTESLIKRVSHDPACHSETWIALLACRGGQAHQFLSLATTEPQLLGPLNRARVYWARLAN